ncbi:MAG: SDR family NAD(P)-dependent oxidoreductase, partial [Hymenobacter sp.]|nr:SDR family NAD(P)-dependent oxidoreductase [Hymenobacter sp.]
MLAYRTTTALVTGASSGIGEAIAHALAAQGVPVPVLIARQARELEALATWLTSETTRVETIVLDLTAADAPARVKAETDRRGLEIDLLVNDAGIGAIGSFDQPREGPGSESTGRVVALNVAALVGLTEQYLPGMVQRGRGGVLNLGSTAAFQPVPYSAVYGASKAFVLSFSQALWAELHDRGHDEVRMVCLCPGVTDTSFGFGHGEPRGDLAGISVSTPAEVARVALVALDTNAPYRVVGAANRALGVASRLLPSPL